MKVLSVIIPYYNGKDNIDDTVNSIKLIPVQKEIIIIDDGSKFDHSAYLQTYLNDSEIKIYKKQNSGIADTRNYGLERATGRYIMFCDQDDIVQADTVMKAVKYMDSDEIDILFWSTERLLDKNDTEPLGTVFLDKKYDRDKIYEELIPEILINTNNKNISYIGHIWACLFKATFIKNNKVKFSKIVDYEDDYLFILDSLIYAKHVKLLTQTGYYWRYNVKSETYRIKYISNFYFKYLKLQEYIDNRIRNLPISEDTLSRYTLFKNQEIVIRSIENIFVFQNKNFIEKKQLEKIIRRKIGYFENDSIYHYKKKRKRIYYLLSRKQIKLCELYIFLDSLRPYFKRKK